MKQQVFYIHGGDSFQNHENFLQKLRTREIRDLPQNPETQMWTNTFRNDLGEDFEVFTPRMPNAQNAQYEEWKIWFERHFEYLRDEVILVGFSLGSMFLAKYLSENALPFKPKALFLLAGAYDIPEFEEGKELKEFLVKPHGLTKLQEIGYKIVIMHSKDDPIVPYEHGLALHEALPEAQLVTFDGRSHFLIEEFPELIELIKSL